MTAKLPENSYHKFPEYIHSELENAVVSQMNLPWTNSAYCPAPFGSRNRNFDLWLEQKETSLPELEEKKKKKKKNFSKNLHSIR